MRIFRRLLPWLALLPLVFLGSCAGLGKKQGINGFALGLLEAIPETRETTLQFERYAKVADKLRKFHDTGELHEEDVLDVLRTGGIIGGLPKKSGSVPSKQVPPPVETYSGPFQWPLTAGIVSSEFGTRWGKNHKGLDVAADLGVPVHAAAAGTVLYSGNGMSGYGNVLILRHDTKLTSLYAHNKQLLVQVGMQVKQGQTIAYLGSTGHSTGPHVHFEIRNGEVAISPRTVLPKRSF